MKTNLLFLFTFSLLIGCSNRSNDSDKNRLTAEKEQVVKQLRHVVLFKFKESSSEADIEKIQLAIIEMCSKISEIQDFEWGLNNSPEKANKGFTHCYFVTFNSEKDRDDYLSHPEHRAIGNVLSPHVEDVLIIDYWAK